jgi:hypothetical protein
MYDYMLAFMLHTGLEILRAASQELCLLSALLLLLLLLSAVAVTATTMKTTSKTRSPAL